MTSIKEKAWRLGAVTVLGAGSVGCLSDQKSPEQAALDQFNTPVPAQTIGTETQQPQGNGVATVDSAELEPVPLSTMEILNEFTSESVAEYLSSIVENTITDPNNEIDDEIQVSWIDFEEDLVEVPETRSQAVLLLTHLQGTNANERSAVPSRIEWGTEVINGEEKVVAHINGQEQPDERTGELIMVNFVPTEEVETIEQLTDPDNPNYINPESPNYLDKLRNSSILVLEPNQPGEKVKWDEATQRFVSINPETEEISDMTVLGDITTWQSELATKEAENPTITPVPPQETQLPPTIEPEETEPAVALTVTPETTPEDEEISENIQEIIDQWNSGEIEIPESARFTLNGEPYHLGLFAEGADPTMYQLVGELLAETVVDDNLVLYMGFEDKGSGPEADRNRFVLPVSAGELSQDELGAYLIRPSGILFGAGTYSPEWIQIPEMQEKLEESVNDVIIVNTFYSDGGFDLSERPQYIRDLVDLLREHFAVGQEVGQFMTQALYNSVDDIQHPSFPINSVITGENVNSLPYVANIEVRPQDVPPDSN